MQNFIITLLTCSATMSAIILIYMAITPLLAKRYQVKWRYYIWLVIVAGLIIPFRPSFGNAIVKIIVPGETATPTFQIGTGTPVAVPVIDAELPFASPGISLWQIMTAVWFAGMIIFLVYQAIRHYRFMKMAGRWSEVITDEQTLTLLESLKRGMGIFKQINLYLCSSVGSPMMFGFVNPRILLPKTALPQDELQFILKHELIHYKRKDLWYKCIVLIATAIHWFNPIVYLMAKAIDMQCELSCDGAVVQSTNQYTRQQYSETIIGVVRYQSKLKTALSTNYLGGKKGMKKRLFSIMDAAPKKTGTTIACVVVFSIILSGLLVACTVGSQNQPPIEPNSQEEPQSRVADPTFNTNPNTQNPDSETDAKYKTEADFLNHPDGVKFQAAAYRAAKAFLNGDLEELAGYLSDSYTVEEELDLFKDVDYMILKWGLYDMKSEDDIRASYEFQLKGEDSVSYVSMELIKVDSEWNVNFIALEK